MDVNISCGVCDGEVMASNVTAAQVEYVFDLFYKHHGHGDMIGTYIWANGAYPSGPALGENGDDGGEPE